jgi:L-2-hydroxycarboxylate dehydrogenase (NAD+)
MKVALEELEQLARRAILSFGYPEEEAALILDVLMYSQLRGGNQGIIKLTGGGIPKASSGGSISIDKETQASALLNGGNKNAMVVVNFAVDVAIRKAGEHGIGLVGVNHLNTSSGAIGYYARRIADAGRIGLVFAGTPPMVAMEGSYQPMLGTNPLAISMPSQDGPIVLDMATSAIAFFGVLEAKTSGRDLPPGCAYDADGQPTIDPSAALKGALKTFGGVKSSGLSFMIQLLTGPLVGASAVGIGDVSGNWAGHLVIAIAPGLFSGEESLRRDVSAVVERVKRAKRLPKIQEILVPGERGDRKVNTARQLSQVDVEENLFRELKEIARAA